MAGLGQFTASQGNFPASTPFPAKEAEDGRPLIVIVREYREDFSTQAYPDPRPAVFVMIADLGPVLDGGEAVLYGNALLGGDAVAERLAKYAGAENEDGSPVKLPVKLGLRASKNGGRKYRIVEPLDGAALKLAEAWDKKNPTALQDARQALQDEADAKAAQEKGGATNGTAAPKATGKFSDAALDKALAALS